MVEPPNFRPNFVLEFQPQNISLSKMRLLLIHLGALCFLSSAVQAQFSVFNRQLFPDFTFPSFGSSRRPSAPAPAAPVPQRRPSPQTSFRQGRFFSNPAPPAPTRFAPRPVFSSPNSLFRWGRYLAQIRDAWFSCLFTWLCFKYRAFLKFYLFCLMWNRFFNSWLFDDFTQKYEWQQIKDIWQMWPKFVHYE